jgi:hypothetical protein
MHSHADERVSPPLLGVILRRGAAASWDSQNLGCGCADN